MKMINKFRSNNNIVFSCQYHVVWCPKYRRKVLINGVDERLKTILYEVAKTTNSEILDLEINEDYVYILISADPQVGINTVIKRMKSKSSNILREEFSWLKSRIPSLWTNNYFICTTGGTDLEAVKQYIENQKNV